MKTVFTHPDSAHIGHAKSILESAGIDCFIQNELSHPFVGGSLIGPIKPLDPELVILNDDDLPKPKPSSNPGPIPPHRPSAGLARTATNPSPAP